MSTTVTVNPVSSVTTQPLPAVSVSADLAKTYADAVAEAKAEILAAEAALKGGASSVESSVSAWFKSNWQHVVTWAGVATTAVPAALDILKHI